MKIRRWATTPRYRAVMRNAARALRANQTKSEALLWNAVRNNALGQRARRQQQIGPFIVDFMFRASYLVIEIDGDVHRFQTKEDHQRQTATESLGYQFLRFSAIEVETNLTNVVRIIRQHLRNVEEPPSK